MGRRSRRKGANYERELARTFAEVMPGADVRRGLQARDGGEVADVECPVFWIEAKRGKRPNPRAALAQAVMASNGSNKVPIAVIRDDGNTEAMVCLGLTDFLEFVGEWWERR